jgi:multidrug efflux pump subunit AcrA (membrane-fusion protein)
MKFSKLLLFPLIAFLSLLPSCQRDDAAAESTKAEEDPGEELPSNRVAIPATVRSNLGLTFAKVERRNVANTLRVPGSFELQPLARHEYRMMLSGHVELLVDQFTEVKAGDPLYRFRSLQLLDLQQRVDLARSSLTQAEAQYQALRKRKTALEEADFKRADLDARMVELETGIDQKLAELRSATAALQNASQASAAAQEQSSVESKVSDWVEVTAHEAAVVETLGITNGAFVEEAGLVLTTVDPTQLRFRAMGLQSDLPEFQNGQQVAIVPPQSSGGDINEAIPAKLRIGLSADPMQRTVTLFALPTEQKSWSRAGVSAFLEIAEESSDGIVLAIPRSAVVKDGITHVFFKRDPLDPNRAIRVEADLGVNDGRWVGIQSGLGPNDEVVLDGVYELKLATAQSGTSQKGGHMHADGSFHEEDE